MRMILIAVMALTCSSLNVAADGDVEKGHALAIKLCAVCHLNEGQGEKRGASGVPGFVAIAKRPSMTIEGIVAWLKSAPPMMPNHHLTTEESESLAAFIASLKGT